MKNFNVLSTFDGLSSLNVALKNINQSPSKYYASEIDPYAMKVANHHFPNIIQLGDIRNINTNHLDHIFLLTGGSPCQSFSFAGKQNGMTTSTNIEITNLNDYLSFKNQNFQFQGQSYLFWEFIRLLNSTKPKYFLLENVRMKKKWENIITKNLNVDPILINSGKLSAQNRDRLYWTNIPNVLQPNDLNIKLSDIIPDAKGCGYRGVKNKLTNKYEKNFTIRKDNKSNCLLTNGSLTNKIIINNTIRNLTVNEREILQNLRMGYTSIPGVPTNQKIKMIGNGWTINVISFILSHIPEFNQTC